MLVFDAQRYILMGAVAAGIDLAVFNIALISLKQLDFDEPTVWAKILAFLAASLVAFFLHRYWTFRNRIFRRSTSQQFWFYAVGVAAGLIISAAMMGSLVAVGFTKTVTGANVANLFTIGLVTVFRFLFSREIAFKSLPVRAKKIESQ